MRVDGPMTPETAAGIIDDIEAVVGPVGETQMRAFGSAYEGADAFRSFLEEWSPGLNSADGDILPIKAVADARSRDLSRNDGYVQAGENVAKDTIVGSMFLLNAKPDIRVLGMDDTWATEMQEEAESKFTLAAESVNCWLDAQGTKTLTEIVRLGVGIYTQTGELLGSAEWLRETPRPFKTAFQFIDLDRLQQPLYAGSTGEIVRGGFRLSQTGKPLGAYIRNAHPTDFDRMMVDSAAMDYTYYPMRKPWGRIQIIHLKNETRAAQTRAVADIVAGLESVQATKKFRRLTLQQAALQAMFAASLESDLPPDAAFSALGASRNPGEGIAEYGAKYLSAVNAFSGKRGVRINDIKVPHFFPGTRLNIRNAGAPGGPGQDFEQSLLRHLAAILGVSYEELSRDFSKTNYSSARAAFQLTWRFMQSRKRFVAERLASIIYTLWFEEQMNAGELEFMKYSKAPNYYEGLNQEAYCSCEWIGAARGQIDELKETQAAVLRLKQGLSTYEDELGRLGKDWRKVFAQLEREQQELQRRGIVLQEDNSINAASGTPRQQDNQDSGGSNAVQYAA